MQLVQDLVSIEHLPYADAGEFRSWMMPDTYQISQQSLREGRKVKEGMRPDALALVHQHHKSASLISHSLGANLCQVKHCVLLSTLVS